MRGFALRLPLFVTATAGSRGLSGLSMTGHTTVGTLRVEQFPCRQDNYGFLVRDEEAGLTAAVDTPDAGAVRALCDKHGWLLTHIFNTHHHSYDVHTR